MSKNLQSHAVMKLYIRTNEANIPRCSIHVFIINNNHAYLILFIFLIFIEDEHHNSVFPPLRALQVQCTTSHAFMQARQQANSSYGGFAKVVPFSHLFFLTNFFFISLWAPLGWFWHGEGVTGFPHFISGGTLTSPTLTLWGYHPRVDTSEYWYSVGDIVITLLYITLWMHFVQTHKIK